MKIKKFQSVEFKADKTYVSGPKASDGSYTVKFETGEYEQLNVAKLMVVPQRAVMTVNVTIDDDQT